MHQIEKMKTLLGTESGSAWLDFMDYIHEELADILQRGKPSEEKIANSIIGKSGFTSWKEMINAPTQAGGLGWNYSTFDLWKRAYKVVLEFPYLRGEELTASLINTIYRERKKNFPVDSFGLEVYLLERKSAQTEKQQNSLKDAQNETKKVKALLVEREEQIDKFQIQIENLKLAHENQIKELRLSYAKRAELDQETISTQASRLEVASRKVGALETEITALNESNKKIKKQKDSEESKAKRYKNLLDEAQTPAWKKLLKKWF